VRNRPIPWTESGNARRRKGEFDGTGDGYCEVREAPEPHGVRLNAGLAGIFYGERNGIED